jgi:hypothetical protein
MTFEEAFYLFRTDNERVAKAIGISPANADRLISAEMDRRYEAKVIQRLSVTASKHRDAQ